MGPSYWAGFHIADEYPSDVYVAYMWPMGVVLLCEGAYIDVHLISILWAFIPFYADSIPFYTNSIPIYANCIPFYSLYAG